MVLTSLRFRLVAALTTSRFRIWGITAQARLEINYFRDFKMHLGGK